MPGNTITVRPQSDLSPGDSAYIDFVSFKGNLPKKGWLAKRGPFDGVVFDSYVDIRLTGEADGMSAPVPQNSARTLDSNTVGNYVKVVNPAGSGVTVAKEDLEIILFGLSAGESREANRLQFSGSAVISDLVPGVTTSGR